MATAVEPAPLQRLLGPPPLMKVSAGEKLHYYDHHTTPEPSSMPRIIPWPTASHAMTMCGRPGREPLISLPPIIEPDEICATCRRALAARS